MDKTKIRNRILKAYLLHVSLFSITVVLIAGAFAAGGEAIQPSMIGRVSALYVTLFVLTLIRIRVADTAWAKDKPYVLINIMFMPLYLIVSLLWLFAFNPFFELREMPLLAGIFLVTFTVAQTIVYFCKKNDTDRMNDALNEFLKEHRENEYEG